ncbi:hypothetical protein KM043_017865 [Ampulex compressa]|nr:hypothetical protein KM043_017865 [Ampulex compressa]
MSTSKIHNIRFYNLEPKSATCLCYEQKTKKLALARNDNSIEIWNVGNAPFVEYTIAGHPENSIEAILWINGRLFSTGLHGLIVEYDLTTLVTKYEVAVTGGAAWCMDVNHEKTHLAIGTEDGYINTFVIDSDALIYERIFDKQKGRILCIKWDNTGEMIYTGSTDTVRVWSAISGHAIHKMTTSRKDAKKETIVWCLEVTDDNIIVSGDSRGCLSFWDPHMGTLIESHESHTADILAVTLSYDMNIVYCAGVDPVVRSFCKIILKSSGKPQWVKGIERRLHAHDVRALVEADGVTVEELKVWLLPKYSCPPTAMAVQKNTLNLVVVYADHKIIEYNIPRKQYTQFSNNLQSRLPKQWLARQFPIANIIFDPHNENIIIMHDDSSVYVINKAFELPEKEAKITKRDNGDVTEDSNSALSLQSQHAFQVVKKYKHLVYLYWLNDDEIVAVEVNPTALTEKLPPTLKQKWFGM